MYQIDVRAVQLVVQPVKVRVETKASCRFSGQINHADLNRVVDQFRVSYFCSLSIDCRYERLAEAQVRVTCTVYPARVNSPAHTDDPILHTHYNDRVRSLDSRRTVQNACSCNLLDRVSPYDLSCR